MSSVTTLGTSGSDGGSTFGGVDHSCGDLVLMASPIRGDTDLLAPNVFSLPVYTPAFCLLFSSSAAASIAILKRWSVARSCCPSHVLGRSHLSCDDCAVG